MTMKASRFIFFMTLLAVFLIGCNKGSNNGDSEVQVEKRGEFVYILGTNEKYTGRVATYHENGKKMEEGNYIDGKLEGTYTTWYDDGIKENEVFFKDGKLVAGSRKSWDKWGKRVNERGYPLRSVIRDQIKSLENNESNSSEEDKLKSAEGEELDSSKIDT